MNSFTANPTAAGTVAHQLIQDRIHDAERRAQVRAVRADRRRAAGCRIPARSPAGDARPALVGLPLPVSRALRCHRRLPEAGPRTLFGARLTSFCDENAGPTPAGPDRLGGCAHDRCP
jgi:hypothetical protein